MINATTQREQAGNRELAEIGPEQDSDDQDERSKIEQTRWPTGVDLVAWYVSKLLITEALVIDGVKIKKRRGEGDQEGEDPTSNIPAGRPAILAIGLVSSVMARFR